LIGLSNTVASPLGMSASKFVSFPTILVTKTCKMLPVMIMGSVLHKHKHSFEKVLSVLLITCGVVTFTLASEEDKKKGGVSGDSFLGLALVFANLFFDALTNSTQDEQVKEYHYSPLQMMLWVNGVGFVWSLVFLFASEVVGANPFVPPQLFSAIELCNQSPTLTYNIIAYALCGASGQLFLFYILGNFGSLTVAGTTVTRKVLNVVLSIWLNGHYLSQVQWMSLVPVSVGVVLDVVLHGKNKKVIPGKIVSERIH